MAAVIAPTIAVGEHHDLATTQEHQAAIGLRRSAVAAAGGGAARVRERVQGSRAAEAGAAAGGSRRDGIGLVSTLAGAGAARRARGAAAAARPRRRYDGRAPRVAGALVRRAAGRV